MRGWPSVAGSIVLGLFLLTPPARAGERPLEDLDRALGVLETSRGEIGADSTTLHAILSNLEQRDAAQQRQFADAARRPLPPKAKERLQAAREAYGSGQGRLLVFLHALVGGPGRTPAGPSAEKVPAEALREAREILDRIQEAARRDPLSSGELKVKAPALAPPALPTTTISPTVTGDQAIGFIPPSIKAAAAALPGPLEVYESVRNSLRSEFYYGAMKGPEQAFLEGSGNDADTAAVLVLMLRAKGIPARYVRGTIEMTAAS